MKELQARKLIRKSLRAFTERFSTEPPPARHHDIIIRKLQSLVERRHEPNACLRLLISAPPGSAKSTYVSQLFAAWFMGTSLIGHRRHIIFGSHTDDLAKHWSARARRLVEDPRYAAGMGVGISADVRGESRWEMSDGGSGFFAVGVRGAPAGRRADGLVVDDPIKGASDAASETVRQQVWEWYTHDLRPRLKPKAIIVLISTRWHHDDLAGRIMPDGWDGGSGTFMARNGETWEVLNFEALSENLAQDPLGRTRVGESCWPEWWSEQYLELERKTQGPFMWSALYQGRPTPTSGLYFHREWLRYYEGDAPANLAIYGASDYATREAEDATDADYTVHGVVGMDAKGDLYVLDVRREQASPDRWVETYIDVVDKWRPLAWGEEAGQIIRSVGPFISRRMRERRVDCYRVRYAAVADKTVRARSFQAAMAAGRVFLPRNAPWLAALVDELMVFPKGKHDDQVDMLGLVGRMLAGLRPGETPAVKPSDPRANIETRPPTFDELIKANEIDDGEQWHRRIA